MPFGTSRSRATFLQALTVGAHGDLARDAAATGGVRHQDRIATGQRQIGGESRALVAALFLHDLHQQDLATLDDFLDLVLLARARLLRTGTSSIASSLPRSSDLVASSTAGSSSVSRERRERDHDAASRPLSPHRPSPRPSPHPSSPDAAPSRHRQMPRLRRSPASTALDASSEASSRRPATRCRHSSRRLRLAAARTRLRERPALAGLRSSASSSSSACARSCSISA